MPFNPLDRLRDFSYKTVVENNEMGAPEVGKPGDYGIEGRRANPTLTPGGGARLAGYGLLSALASEALGPVEDAIVSGMEPVFDEAAALVKGEKQFNFRPNLGTLGRGMY